MNTTHGLCLRACSEGGKEGGREGKERKGEREGKRERKEEREGGKEGGREEGKEGKIQRNKVKEREDRKRGKEGEGERVKRDQGLNIPFPPHFIFPQKELLIPKSFLILAAPTPTNISSNSEPDTKKNGTSASPAMAFARRVLPVPGGPIKSKPGEEGNI